MPNLDVLQGTPGESSIYYETHGAETHGDEQNGNEGGSAVVFAHGAGGNSLSWWQQVPHFARRHRVITFDHRTFGRSRCKPGGFRTSYFSSDLLAILDAEGIARAALVCQSMGGWTGLPLAIHHPERVACLVLCDTPGGLYTDQIAQALARTGERIRSAGIDANAALAPSFPERRPEMAHLYAQISALNVAALPTALAALLAEEARISPDELASYRTPTLVLAGEHDLLFPREMMAHVAELIPGAELRDFPGCGHSTYFEDPRAFNEHVGAFVAKHL